MSISGEFVKAEIAADLLSSSECFRELQLNSMNVRWLRKPDGAEVILVEGGFGEYVLIS